MEQSVKSVALPVELSQLGVEAIEVSGTSQNVTPNKLFTTDDLYSLRSFVKGRKEDFKSEKDFHDCSLIVDNLIAMFSPEKERDFQYASYYAFHVLFMLAKHLDWTGPRLLEQYLFVTELDHFRLLYEETDETHKGKMHPITIFRAYCFEKLQGLLMETVASKVVPLILQQVKYDRINLNDFIKVDSFATLYRELADMMNMELSEELYAFFRNMHMTLFMNRNSESSLLTAFDVLRYTYCTQHLFPFNDEVKVQEMETMLKNACEECQKGFYALKCSHRENVRDPLTLEQSDSCMEVVNKIASSVVTLMKLAKRRSEAEFERVYEQIYALLMARPACSVQSYITSMKAFLCTYAMSGSPKFSNEWNRLFPDSTLYRQDQAGYLLSRVFHELVVLPEKKMTELVSVLDFSIEQQQSTGADDESSTFMKLHSSKNK